MAAIVIPNNRRDTFQQTLMAIFANMEEQERERKRLAQQESQFTRTLEAGRPLTEAQIRASNASADATMAGVEHNKRVVTFEENKVAADSFIKNAYEPLLAAGRITEAEQLRSAYSKNNPLVAWTERPATTLDEAAANLSRWKADTTKRVADGGQNVMDVNLATKLATGEQLTAPSFGNQEQREFGTKALRDAVAIKGDRAPGATANLQAATTRDVASMQGQTARDVARINADTDLAQTKLTVDARGGADGTKPLSGEASKVLAIARTVQPEIERLKQAFEENYRGALLGMATGTNRELVKLRDNIADKLGRLRSGGAINKDEEARFIRQLGGIGDAAFGNVDEARQALDGILAEARSVENSIIGADADTTKTMSDGTTWRRVDGGWERVK